MSLGKNKWLTLITIPSQMGITIYLSSLLGTYLDDKYQVNYWYKVCTLLGVFIAIFQVIRQVNQLNKEKE